MPERGEKPLGELFSELLHEVQTLFRQEMALFRTETIDKVKHVAIDAGAMMVGGVLLYTGFLVLVAAVVLGVAVFLPAWGAALIVACLLFAVGAALLVKGGKDLKQMEIKPEQTAESLKETARWAKTLRVHSSPRPSGFGKTSGTRNAI